MARSDSNISWSAPGNLKVWNYDRLFGDESAASEFIGADTYCANYAELYGATVANNNPELMVYVINISRGQSSLERWLPDAESINMLQAILNNVPAALATIPGKETIDELLWWGHESDAAPEGGLAVGDFKRAFLNVINTLDEQVWSNGATYPVHLHRIHRKCHVLADSINFSLACIVLENPERFALHDTTCFTYSDNIHLDGDQKNKAVLDVYHGHCKMKMIDTQINNTNFLLSSDNNTTSSVESEHIIAPGERLYFVVNSIGLAGEVVCVSIGQATTELNVSLSGQEGVLRSGNSREFISFHVPKAFNETIRLVLTPATSQPVRFSGLKLEKGYGYTPISAVTEELG